MKRAFFAAAMALSSMGALADGCTATGCIGYGAEAVASVYLCGSGDVNLEAPAAQRANLNCTLSGGAYMGKRSSNHALDVRRLLAVPR